MTGVAIRASYICCIDNIFYIQFVDTLKANASREFRANRIKAREQEFLERRMASEKAASEYDNKKLARKAITQLNYERRIRLGQD